jgi:RHS repeat-associated protein
MSRKPFNTYFQALPPYLGGKRKLIPWIFNRLSQIVSPTEWANLTFLDAFTGGGAVSLYAKAQGFQKVHSNDWSERSQFIIQGLLENQSIRLTREDQLRLVQPFPTDSTPGFVQSQFCPSVFSQRHAQALDRLINESTPQGSLSYTYDLVSRLTGFSSPDTGYAPVQYAYDNLDRLTSITQNSKTYSYGYDVLGRRTGVNRPNGVTTSYEYDAGSRLTALTHSKGAQVLEKHDYTYDANGNIVKYVRGKGTSQPVVVKPCGKNGKGQIRKIVGYLADKAETLERTYTHDALDRVTSVNGLGMVPSASKFKHPGQKLAAAQMIELAKRMSNPNAKQELLRNAQKLGAVLPESASWTFDANGNIASKTIQLPGQTVSKAMTYDEADRLTQMVTTRTGRREDDHDHDRDDDDDDHDGHGRHGHVPAVGPQTVTLNYDENGNLVSDSTGRTFTWNAQDQLTRLQTPNLSTDFRYDPQGRRIRLERGSTLKTYFYQGLDLLSDGSSKFLHGAGIDQPLQLDGPTGSQSYLQDHLGSTSQLLDSTTALSKARLDYKSYGKLEGDIANPQPANPFTYTGREDDGTGLMYYRARYYDPELEVFISQDPLGDAQRYVGGNPMELVDPLGLKGSLQINMGYMWRNIGQPGSFDNVMEDATNTNSKIVAGVAPWNTPDTRAFSAMAVSNAITIYQPTDTLIIRAHGNPTSIGAYGPAPNNQHMERMITLGNLAQAFSPILSKKVDAPKRIVINACQTGYSTRDVMSIAQELSQLLYKSGNGGVQVVAPRFNQQLPTMQQAMSFVYIDGKLSQINTYP